VTTGETIAVEADLEEAAERLEPLTGVRTYPARVKCATLAWHAFDAALKAVSWLASSRRNSAMTTHELPVLHKPRTTKIERRRRTKAIRRCKRRSWKR